MKAQPFKRIFLTLPSKTSHVFVFFAFLCAVLFTPFVSAQAQTITVLDTYEFSQLIVKDNRAPRTFRITYDNRKIFNQRHFASLSPVRAARIRIQGFPRNTDLFITVNATPLLHNGVGPKALYVTNVSTDPPQPRTNGGGNINVIRFDTTLITDGDGAPYPEGDYSGTIEFIINY